MKWKFRLVLSAVLPLTVFAAPEIAPGKAWKEKKEQSVVKTEPAVPKIEGEAILCGNKRLEMTPDGNIRISADGKLLAEVYCYYAIKNQKSGNIDWGSFTKPLCSVKRDGNKFVWTLMKKTPEAVWKAADQTLEIAPDGLLKFSARFYKPSHPDWELRSESAWVILPADPADGSRIVYNGTEHVLALNGKAPVGDYRSKNFEYRLYADEPGKMFSVHSSKQNLHLTALEAYPGNKHFRLTWQFSKDNNGEGVFFIDLRESPPPRTSPDLRGGVDFKAIENLELPDGSGKNLFVNASFERGLEGYRIKHPNYDGQWNWTPFALDAKESFSGGHSLKMDARPLKDIDYRRLHYGVNLTTTVAVVPSGKYTASLYAKCEPGATAELNAWIPNFHSGSLYAAFSQEAIGRFSVSPEWKRYSFSFDVKQAMPLEMHFNVWSRSDRLVRVWVDALQLDRGGQATAFEPRPVEGWLRTSDPDNFVSAKNRIDGRLTITTDKKNMAGTANIRVKNFFGEELLNRKFDFRTDEKGTAEIALPLDDLPGLGVFMLRADYELADGAKAYDFRRYSKVEFLENKHRLKNLFSADYAYPERFYDFLHRLERWKQTGSGMKAHHHTYRKEVWDTERKYGVTPLSAFMMSWLCDRNRKLLGFGILDADATGSYVLPDDKRLLVRDFYFDSNGKITPEYLEKFKNAAKTVAAKYPHVPMWCLAGEFIAKFPPEWWSANGSPEECARIHAQLLKAFADGVREGNPGAKIFQDDPCNMRPEGGIAETARLLAECNKLGVKFDRIAIHPYRQSPESPDLDADAQTFFKMLEKHGYGKTPVMWPEMMHWGPFRIPQWGVDPSTWGNIPRTWSGALLSYDMGWTEKLSAAWYARAYLVALKYSDRIVTATAGNASNNFAMDVMFTPYAAQLIPNTLGWLLGDSYFKKDIRFAPFIRAYVFEDARKRPVAAVWCHLDKVDDGRSDAPVAEADFGDSLEGVFDLMNSPRNFTAEKFRFPVSSFPVFLRGKPGTLTKMISALEKAVIVSGEGVSPLEVIANPLNGREARITFRNFLSGPFKGSIGKTPVEVPGSGTATVTLPLPAPLKDNAVTPEPLNFRLRADSGAEYEYNLPFEAFEAKRIAGDASFSNMKWETVPMIAFPRNYLAKETSGFFRLAWNRSGLFLEVTVKDGKFVHTEYPKTSERWNNDCLQIYIDTMADARSKRHGYDENDYDYALFPNAKGDSALVFRNRSVEQQLGLATQAPPDNTVASDIPCSFSNRDGVLTYRVFFPAKYLLPVQLQKGSVFGFGLFVPNADVPGKVSSALTLATDGGGCFNRPHVWPAVLLTGQ